MPRTDSGNDVDDRVRRSRSAVLDATAEILFERGWSGASVDEISRRSGVAKTTIYRHWPSRADLLRDACAALGGPQAVPDTGSFEMDVSALVSDLARTLRTAKWTSVMPSVIDAAERDPAMAEMHAKLQRGYAKPFEIVVERGIERGELHADVNTSVLIAALVGPLFYRRWFSREPVTDAFAARVVADVLGSLARQTSRARNEPC